ncbi:MAG TPA: Dyp-type peroxidase [Candidatus Lustribacter sp.]|jgi:putative iron-dependent peroxidase|nr:Dyp-type peroxidase [Candidatus Lustribacter sp.]
MATPQTGIFALGDAAHIYLEFLVKPGTDAETLVRAALAIQEPRTTVGGVNAVVGFRPELWRKVAPDDTPAELTGFNAPLAGAAGYSMPATQADLFLWIAGASYDVVFDLGGEAIAKLANVASPIRELDGWSYRHSRDLTGFEDGTKNPALMIAPSIATVPDGSPGAGGSVLLFQQWEHQTAAWEGIGDAAQERVIGRTKPDSVEFPEATMPKDSHVSRTTVDVDGTERKIFRRNTAYGNVTTHGTVFVGFSADQQRLNLMLRQMAGSDDGVRDALTKYTTVLTGAYYFVPSLQALQRFAPPQEDD